MKVSGNFSSVMRKQTYLSNITKVLKLKYIMPIILGLVPTLGFAANLFDPSSGDISLKVLGALFGGLMDGAGGGADPMLGAIKIFNGCVLIIGGILAAYTILAGTLGTAHDGEMLGKKFSSVWIPIRYSVGTALVLPIVGGGYCVMQAIVMWLVVQGIGLADQVWGSYMSNPAASANTSVTTSVSTDIRNVAENAFRSSVCYKSFQKVVQAEQQSGGTLNWGNLYNFSQQKTDRGYIYGDSKALLAKSACGGVNYSQNKAVDIAYINSTPSTNPGYLGNFSNIFAPMDVTSINTVQNEQTDALVQKMDALADKVLAKADTMTPSEAQAFYQEIKDASTAYELSLKNIGASLQSTDAFQAITQSANNQGWMLAGAWFTRIIQMNQTINAAINSTPTASGPILNDTDNFLYVDAKQYMRTSDAVLSNSFTNNSIGTPANSGTNSGTSGDKGQIEDTSTIWKKIQSGITETLTTVNLYELKNDSRHPIIVLNELGQRLSTICVTLMGILAGIVIAFSTVLSSYPGASNIITNALTVLGWFVDVPVKLLMGTAMGTQYILPNMPFIIWIGCIVGWTLLVIEAVIAAPLWAIMHLHPNGDDLTGRGGNGYMLVLSLLLRPVLMIFGVIAAIVISSVIGEFINKTFFEVFAQSTGSITGFMALMGLAMGTLLYFIVMFTFIRKCFGIIHQLPDQLLKWIGGGDQALGQFAGEFAGAADKGGQAGAALGGFAASSIGQGGKAYIKHRSDMNLKQEKEEQREIQNEDNTVEGVAGKGAASTRNNFSEMKNNAVARKAYNDALIGAVATDELQGRNEFEVAFADSHKNDHKAYGGDATLAAHSIGQGVIAKNIQENMGPVADFVIQASSGADGIDGKKAKSIMNTVNRMSNKIGGERTQEILSQALAQGGDVLGNAREAYSNIKFGENGNGKTGGNTDGNTGNE